MHLTFKPPPPNPGRLILSLFFTSPECGCECVCVPNGDGTHTAQAYDPSPVSDECGKPDTACETYEVACYKCGQALECYIDADPVNDATNYNLVVAAIMSDDFCNANDQTDCGKQPNCAARTTYPIKDLPNDCPIVDGGDEEECYPLEPKNCQQGAGRDGLSRAALSNFVVYEVDVSGCPSCEASAACISVPGTWGNDISTTCTVDEPGCESSGAAITCEAKCEEDNTVCPCPEGSPFCAGCGDEVDCCVAVPPAECPVPEERRRLGGSPWN